MDRKKRKLDSAAPFYFSWLEDTHRQLKVVRQEAKAACALDSELDPGSESAYTETLVFLEQISKNVPVPDMMGLEDGGIGLEWRPGDGIVTVSLYGDEHVNFVIILGDRHEMAGTCPLSDHLLFPNFLTILDNLFCSRRNIDDISQDELLTGFIFSSKCFSPISEYPIRIRG